MIRFGCSSTPCGSMSSRPVRGDLRQGAAIDPDPCTREPIRHDVAGGGPKDGERPRLRCHEHQLEVADVHALRPLRRHERELVERQRPHRADRLDEREASGVALLDVLHDALVGLVGVRVPERRDVLVGLDLPWRRPRSAGRRTPRAFRRPCGRPGHRDRPTQASPAPSRHRHHVRYAPADSGAAARLRTARARPWGGRRAPRWGRSARCPPSPLPADAVEGDLRPRQSHRHKQLPENRS